MTIAPIWTSGHDDDEDAWTLGEIMAAHAVAHVDLQASLRVLAILRGLRDRP